MENIYIFHNGGIKLKTFNYIVLALLIIGALNWGLVGFFKFDLVASIFGDMSVFSRIIYCIIGLCAIYSLTFFSKDKFI